MVRLRRPISDDERRAIEAAIRDAERATSAEFVAAIVRRAEGHHAVGLTAGLVAALVVPSIALLWDPWISVALSLGLQCAAFAVVYALFEFTALSARLAPPGKRAMKVRRLARLLFFERGLGGLPTHNGVLLLVALAERQVEIVADHGIDGLVGTSEWQRIVDSFSATARTGKVAKALETAIRDLGTVLGRHFPATPGASNHVPDRLIEL
jgi:putative membrane protein